MPGEGKEALIRVTPAAPELSVVIVAPDGWAAIRETIKHLREQSVRDRIEIVVAAPAADRLGPDASELAGFCGVKTIEVGPIGSTAKARAMAIREASAPIVAFAEDHSYPEPKWAEMLIRAHQEPWAAVGPVMCNANPGSAISWADFVMGYGPWMDPAPCGSLGDLPGHNSSYKRALLLVYGARLESMLEADTILHWDLLGKGHKLYLESGARTHHTNFERPFAWLSAAFYSGRLFASARARLWPDRRPFYVAAAPLIPLIRLWRGVAEFRRPGRPRGVLPRILLFLAAGLVADGLGQIMGYALGPGNAKQKLIKFEHDRQRYVRARSARGEGFGKA